MAEVELIRVFSTDNDGAPIGYGGPLESDDGDDLAHVADLVGASWPPAGLAAAAVPETVCGDDFHSWLLTDEGSYRTFADATGVRVERGPVTCPVCECGLSEPGEEPLDAEEEAWYDEYAAATGVSASTGAPAKVESAPGGSSSIFPVADDGADGAPGEAWYDEYAAATGVPRPVTANAKTRPGVAPRTGTPPTIEALRTERDELATKLQAALAERDQAAADYEACTDRPRRRAGDAGQRAGPRRDHADEYDQHKYRAEGTSPTQLARRDRGIAVAEALEASCARRPAPSLPKSRPIGLAPSAS